MKRWIDTMITGIIAGLIGPIIAFLIYASVFRSYEAVVDVLNRFIVRNVLTHVISLAAIPNLLVFFLFLWSGKERAAYGVIGATLIYALFVAGLILI